VLFSTNRKCFQMIWGLKDSTVARVLFFEDSCNDLIPSDSDVIMYKKNRNQSNELVFPRL